MFLAGLFDIVPNRSSRLQKGEIKKIYICGLKMFSNKTEKTVYCITEQ